jgi:hypothetical protein
LVNWDWRTKLKTNRTSTKKTNKKTRNKKIKDLSWNTNNKEGQVVMFGEGKRKKKRKKAHLRQTKPPPPTCIAPTGKWHKDASNNMMEGYFWIPRLMSFKVRGCLQHAFECWTRTWFFFCFVYIHIAKYQLLLSRPGQKIMVK